MDYPNDVIRTLFEKHTIRRFLPNPIDREQLELVVEAGLRAPSAGGAQSPTLLVCEDAEINRKLGQLNLALYDEGPYHVSDAQPSVLDDPALDDALYGAPAVVHCFTPRGWAYGAHDGSMAAAHMMIAAWSLGIGSCFVARADKVFERGWPREWARSCGVPDAGEGCFHLCLGYPSDWGWSPKPRYPDRLFWAG